MVFVKYKELSAAKAFLCLTSLCINPPIGGGVATLCGCSEQEQ